MTARLSTRARLARGQRRCPTCNRWIHIHRGGGPAVNTLRRHNITGATRCPGSGAYPTVVVTLTATGGRL